MDDGKILNPNLVDYKVMRATEMPETKVFEVETYEPEGPFGAKEAGEGLTNPTAGALGNAIYHATGLSIKNLPITPEKVLDSFRERNEKKEKNEKDEQKGGDTVGHKCPVCEKIWSDTMDIARHIFGIDDQPHKDWVNSKGLNFIELLLIQTMEPGNKVYKTLTEILEKEAVKVDEEY